MERSSRVRGFITRALTGTRGPKGRSYRVMGLNEGEEEN